MANGRLTYLPQYSGLGLSEADKIRITEPPQYLLSCHARPEAYFQS
jgi:hypothetical protein